MTCFLQFHPVQLEWSFATCYLQLFPGGHGHDRQTNTVYLSRARATKNKKTKKENNLRMINFSVCVLFRARCSCCLCQFRPRSSWHRVPTWVPHHATCQRARPPGRRQEKPCTDQAVRLGKVITRIYHLILRMVMIGTFAHVEALWHSFHCFTVCLGTNWVTLCNNCRGFRSWPFSELNDTSSYKCRCFERPREWKHATRALPEASFEASVLHCQKDQEHVRTSRAAKPSSSSVQLTSSAATGAEEGSKRSVFFATSEAKLSQAGPEGFRTFNEIKPW